MTKKPVNHWSCPINRRFEALTVEENIKSQMSSLIERANSLKVGHHEFKQVRSPKHAQECSGWLASALNVVQLACPSSENAYRRRAEKIENKEHGYLINEAVGEFACLLNELQRDIENGLLSSVAERARAETFDNFLDHAKEYFKEGLKNEAGVISGVVFEDSLRRVCRKIGKDDKDEKFVFFSWYGKQSQGYQSCVAEKTLS